MADVASDMMLKSSGGSTPSERLAAAIGYPERISKGSVSAVLRVDGVEIATEEMDGRLVLSCGLTDDESLLPTLAVYAAGRMLKEDATLSVRSSTARQPDGSAGSFSSAKPSGCQAFLWQDAPANASAHELLRFFETFMDSCDWWRARVEALRGNGAEETAAPEAVMIRP